MTGTASFDLEPEQDESPLDWQVPAEEGPHADPRLPPPRTGLRRSRRGSASGGGDAGQEDQTATGRSRYFRWLISPTFYYVVGLLGALGLLLVCFNPEFGIVSRMWWIDALQESGPRLYESTAASLAAALVLCIVGATIGLWLKRWRYRPAFMLLVFSIPFLSSGMALYGPLALYWLIGAAVLGGVLLSPARRGRRGHLLAATLLLAGLLFVPWGEVVGKDRRFSFPAWAYASAPASEADHHVGYVSPATMVWDALQGEGDWDDLHLLSMTLGLAILALGLIAWMGLGGTWVRWAAGALLLGIYSWITAKSMMASGWDGWQAGAAVWGQALQHGALLLFLPLAAAVSEARAPGDR